MRGTAKSTNHGANVIDMLKQIYDKPSTLADIGITTVRSAKIYKLVAGLSTDVTQQKQEKELKPSTGPIYQEIIDTFPSNSDSIWDEIDLLEGDPPHRGVALRNLKFKRFWLAAEEAEWAGLW